MAELSRLLRAVCAVLAGPSPPPLDDAALEKLLDWAETARDAQSAQRLLEENPCLTEMVRAVLRREEPLSRCLSFALRLTGVLSASEGAFALPQQREVVLSAFGGDGPREGPLWEDSAVRSGWLRGAQQMLRHRSALRFFCEEDSGALEVVFSLQGDRSLFVSSGAGRLLAQMLILAVQVEPHSPLTTKDCEWPSCARRILSHVERSLRSRSSSRVKQALQVLTTLFERCHDGWTEVLWSRIAETVETLLTEGEVHVGHSLVDLLLSMARSSAFSGPESSFWKVIPIALKCLSPSQGGPLAVGLLKLEDCPQAMKTESLSVLLRPMDCVLRATAHSTNFSGVLSGTSAVEPLLSSRPLCVGLLCQTLTHLEEVLPVCGFSAEFLLQPLLCSVITVLQFGVGLAVPVSPLGVTLGRVLVGSFRVQRAALGLLGALSQWAPSGHRTATEEATKILLVYLRGPDTSPTVLKKGFQAVLKWLLSSADTSGSTEDFQCHRRFLGEVLPVVQKRMCSPSWEVRDSALEFLIQMAKHWREQEWFWAVLSSSETPALAESLLEDPESYVRASAVKAAGEFSFMAAVHSQTVASDQNGSDKQAGVADRLLQILSTDSEGFPRRAVIGVFTDWLREGHPSVLTDPERFFARAIQVASRDLDWEVKVSGLELAEVFAALTLGPSGAVDSPASCLPECLPEALQTFCRVRLFDLLFGALGDCDRPVALKACEVLLAVKAKVCKDSSPQEGQRAGLGGSALPEETLERMASSLPSEGAVPQDPLHVLLILESLDLEGLRRWLDRGSDCLQSSPLSLLQDILSAGGEGEDHDADCY